MSDLHDAIELAIKEHCSGGDLWLCANIASKPFDARIAELEQAVVIRDTEIARLETDLELARRNVVRLKSKVNATFDAIHEHTSRAATKRIFAAVKDFDPAVGE